MENKSISNLGKNMVLNIQNKDSKYIKILMDVLQGAKEKKYSGYNKFDALNSPFLNLLSLNNPWLRLIYTQVVMRSPLNLRPILGVKKTINPKGVALFIRAYLFLYEKTMDKKYLIEAENLANWLIKNKSPNQKHLCWGYSYFWQDIPPFYQGKNQPNIIVTTFVGEAFVHLFRSTGDKKYLKFLGSIGNFITYDLPVMYETKHERAVSYVQSKVDYIVLNAQVLSATLLAKIYKYTGEKRFISVAKKQMAFTVNRRTNYYAWYYTYPSGKSYILHDNYHTGGIIDGILEFFEETKDESYLKVYWNGLKYYQENLFEENGAPKWMNDKKYPYDVHGAAQGIISFSKAGRYKKQYLKQAEKIVNWSISNLYRGKNHDFIYRKGRIIKWNYSLMRWSNAWMARAMGEFLISK